jgi:hypothetical protein
MRKLLDRRPSAGAIIGLLALVLALGGGAYAQKAKKKKIPYKGLDKDARLKVLPISATNAGTAPCDPTSATTFTDCTSVSTTVSTAFPRRVMLVFDGTINEGTTPAPPPGTIARGDCRLEADNNPITGTTVKVETTPHTANHGEGVGINIVTTPLGGRHTFTVACNENEGDLKIQDYQLSAITVR